MYALPIALGIALPAFLVVAVVAIVQSVTAGLRKAQGDPVAHTVRRRTVGATAVACLAALVAGVLGPDAEAAPAVATVTLLGIGVVMSVAATFVELTWPRPRGSVRTAVASPRPQPSRTLRWLRTSSAATLAVLCVGGALLGGSDGTSIRASWPGGAAAQSPFPGWRYGLGLLIALALLTAATQWGLRVVEARPALEPGHAALDTAARMVSSARLLRIAATTTWLTVLGVAFVAGSSLHELAQGLRGTESPAALYPPVDWRQDLAFALFGLGALAGVLALAAATAPAHPAAAPSAETAPVEVHG